MTEKPHNGFIINWTKVKMPPPLPMDCGLGFCVHGEFLSHPTGLRGMTSSTSRVLAFAPGDHDTYDIETRNSRYTLIGPCLDSPHKSTKLMDLPYGADLEKAFRAINHDRLRVILRDLAEVLAEVSESRRRLARRGTSRRSRAGTSSV